MSFFVIPGEGMSPFPTNYGIAITTLGPSATNALHTLFVPSHGTTGLPLNYASAMPPYGLSDLSFLSAGSGGCSATEFSGFYFYDAIFLGGAGGGAVDVRAAGSCSVLGRIDVGGGRGYYPSMCGSGGAIKLGSFGNTSVVGTGTNLVGGSTLYTGYFGRAGNGRWAIQSWNGTKSNGTTPSIPAGVY